MLHCFSLGRSIFSLACLPIQAEYFISHGGYDSHREGFPQKLIDVFDVGVLMHRPLEVKQEFIPVDVPVIVHVDGLQGLLRVRTHEAAKVGSHKAIVEGAEHQLVVVLFIILEVPLVPNLANVFKKLYGIFTV